MRLDGNAAQGLNLRHLVEKRQTLEDLFLTTHDARPTMREKPPASDKTGASANVQVLKPATEVRPS